MRSPCPNCHDCGFPRGVCEQLANRGRRFFLLGALALPVARKIERVAKVIAPPAPAPQRIVLTFGGKEHVWEALALERRNGLWAWSMTSEFAVAT